MSDSRLASFLAPLWHQIKSEEQGCFIKAWACLLSVLSLSELCNGTIWPVISFKFACKWDWLAVCLLGGRSHPALLIQSISLSCYLGAWSWARMSPGLKIFF